MRTALQELIYWMEKRSMQFDSATYNKATELLAKEKEQIVDAYHACENDILMVRKHKNGADYFNQTYKP